MSEFKDLVKKFAKTREYVRDFFVYGFKSRDEFDSKSARTYDNERRRLESWLGDYVRQDYTSNGKNISLAIDSNLLDINPLYKVWKTKSFTDNDIMLHFFILDLLGNTEDVVTGTNSDDTSSLVKKYTIEEITDKIVELYNVDFDAQMVRRKCNAYVSEGLLKKEKVGKELLYYKSESFDELFSKHAALKDATSFFQLISPFGFIGDTIQDNTSTSNHTFRVKHNFLVYTLEDEILSDILEAIQNKQQIVLKIIATKSKQEQAINGCPIKIFTSTGTGRRFICMYLLEKKRFACYRLDSIKSVEQLGTALNYDDLKDALSKNLKSTWGVSFQNGGTNRLEYIKLTLRVHENREAYIIERLEREGRGGTITKIAPNTFTYEKEVFDCNEMLPWLRTFTGRIIDLESNSDFIKSKFNRDLELMYKIYDID